MAFPILGAGSLAEGYNVENSCRFDNTGGSALGITFGTPTNGKAFTLSMWFKMCAGTIGGGRTVFGGRSGYENIFLHEDTLRWDWNNASSGTINWLPDFRDHSAWYHWVFAQDTAQGTDTNRAKLYVNGTQITTLRPNVTQTWPAQNLITGYNEDGIAFYLSSYNGTAGETNNYVADVVFVDGTQYAASTFGETDSDTGIWKPKDISDIKDAVTFGNNGFCLEFKQTGTGTNASGIGADTSGEDNHLSVAGLAAIDITTDTPTNNFCTMNPTDVPPSTYHTFSEGNCKVAWSAAAGNFGVVKGTTGLSSGKWYWEVKYTYGNAVQLGVFDITNMAQTLTGDVFSNAQSSDFTGLAWRIDTANNIKEVGEGQSTDSGVDFSTGDILGIAFDADNGKLYAWDNGTELTGQDIGAGTSLLTAVTVSDFYLPFVSNGDGGSGTKTGTSELNFGNPTFSISSGNSDANGYGNFEYAVPSGYYAICTKNLALYGG